MCKCCKLQLVCVCLPVCGMIEIQMASWQSICKRLRSKHFSLCLCSPCQAHETEIKSQRDKRPNSKQTVAHCAVVNSNEAMAARVVSQTHTERHTSQPSRPLAVAKSRSPHGSAAAVCLVGRIRTGCGAGYGWSATFACGCICPQKGERF